MNYFSNPDAEERAQRILLKQFQVLSGISFEPIDSDEWFVSDSEITYFRNQVYGNSTAFATKFFNECLTDLKVIGKIVGWTDPTFKEISNAVSASILNILKRRLHFASLICLRPDFKKQQNHPDIIKLKQDLIDSKVLLQLVKENTMMGSVC